RRPSRNIKPCAPTGSWSCSATCPNRSKKTSIGWLINCTVFWSAASELNTASPCSFFEHAAPASAKQKHLLARRAPRQFKRSSQPRGQVLGHEVVIAQMGIGPTHPVDLLGLAGRELFVGIQTTIIGEQSLPAQHLMDAR